MSERMAAVRDRPREARSITVRWILIYISASAVFLEVLDVFSERLGVPDRFFVIAVVALVLALPGVAGAGALRGLSEEEGTPRPPASPARTSAAVRPPPPTTASPSAADLAELHYRLARFYETRGEVSRAAYHYERHLEIGGATGSRDPPEGERDRGHG